MDCIFCKITNKEIFSEIAYEDEDVLAIRDIKPKAAVHILILPKKHITSVNHLDLKDSKIISAVLMAAPKIAEKQGLKGYKISINVGKEGGQLIDHLHLHLLGGKIEEMP